MPQRQKSTIGEGGTTKPNVTVVNPCRVATVLASATTALCAESEVRKAVERSSYAVALKFRVFFLLLKSVKF